MRNAPSCPDTFGHSRLSSLSHCRLFLAQRRVELVCASYFLLKKKKKAQAGNVWFSHNPRQQGKIHRHRPDAIYSRVVGSGFEKWNIISRVNAISQARKESLKHQRAWENTRISHPFENIKVKRSFPVGCESRGDCKIDVRAWFGRSC